MAEERTFEQNMQELQTIIQQLEQGQVPLQTAINQYKRGMDLSKQLNDELTRAKATITRIVNDDGTEENFKRDDINE